MNRRWIAVLWLCLGAFAGDADAQSTGGASAAMPARAAPPASRVAGFLGRDGVPDHRVFMPPPPAEDAPLGVADLEIYRATRALEGTPRWELAAKDAEAGPALVADFGCALGVDLSGASTPRLSRLLARAVADVSPIIGGAKDHYRRKRPFLVEEGPVCIVPSEEFAASGSYPSGHSAVGWLYALVLAQVAPEHAAAILARGRAYGESRVVCGVHYPSDVDAGRLASSVVFAALAGNAEFQADVAAAREELAALRKAATPPPAARCAIENAAASQRPW
ncbi:MAG TPA: phosphatase PAP2 family protein [Gammaproteobacteria bacterium]